MIKVCCVLVAGGPYTPAWVHALADGVAMALDEPYEFCCLTNYHPSQFDECIHVVEAESALPGYWSKIELFYHFTGPGNLYLDLDNVIVGNLDALVQREPGFRMVPDFATNNKNSCVMSWSGDYSEVFHTFFRNADDYMETYRRTADGRIGDQAYIEDAISAETYDPGQVLSYKRDLKMGSGNFRENTSVVQFHGRPKQNEVIEGWVKSLWSL